MTKQILTPKKWIGKKKEGEIYRFQLLLAELNLKPEDIQKDTGVTVRTITNSIYEKKPLGAKLLREIHAKYGVSIDWLLSGKGQMFASADDSATSAVREPNGEYGSDPRFERIMTLVRDFMANADDDEKAWLETQVKLNIAQYQQHLKSVPDEN
ncbi:hypothetical protein MSP8886_04300 [Marinomonas spartinae]|uniref:HTH cro/C1-type domain-containing protein n=1 Tax=Marinomonas spartinae TaxID=1792290 RepID=A0A1A8TVN8_9GAMM|nr:helix-turn-helix transcriptional regulator [Marinomonas spartinae]SBS37873.1 hypothetical protein MSP8886_04300 [Marinomonas spartinae]